MLKNNDNRAMECRECKKTRYITDFIKNNRISLGYDRLCKICYNKMHRQWNETNNEHVITSRKVRYKEKKKLGLLVETDEQEIYRKGLQKIWRDSLREEFLTAYGRKCSCCGEGHVLFLTLDHIGGKHNTPRLSKSMGSWAEYSKLKKLGWPKDKYRLLCMNCNFGTRHNDTCPHKMKRE
jgi:hypothetical protein